MKFSFRRRHGVLLAGLVSTGALGMAWTQNTDLDLWSSLESVDLIFADDSSASSPDPVLTGVPPMGNGYTVSNSLPTGFITYRAPHNTLPEADEPGNSQNENPTEDESLDLVFEATGAGYSGRGFSRFLGASSGVELGAIVSGATTSLAQQTYVASISPLQGGYGVVASRESSAEENSTEESTPDETTAGGGNEEGTTEPVIVGSSDEPGSDETGTPTTDSNDSQRNPEPGAKTDEDKAQEEVVEVNEPSTLILLGLGLFGLGLMSNRSRKGLLQA